MSRTAAFRIEIHERTPIPMYTLIRSIPTRKLLSEQLPALCVAFLIAEVLYKFHSFTLECGAFLATWFVADAVIQGIVRVCQSRPASIPPPTDSV
jgi:hypothetical protein